MKRALFQLWFILVVASRFSMYAAQPNPGPPLPPPVSPVAMFRMLLATNAEGRDQWLAKRTPEQREIALAKINEYASLSPDEREKRLQTLELRWYLPQLMKLNAAERATRLATIPQPERTLLMDKLRTWDITPPPIKKDLLDNQQVISLFLFPGPSSSNDSVLRSLTPQRREELQRQFEQLNKLPKEKREQILANFQRFFELPSTEQSKALQKLTPTERTQMQQTLTTFDSQPPEQRQQALAGFRKFAELSPADRADFLKTAARWQKMSEAEREAWRRMVSRVQELRARTPPLPPLPAIRAPETVLVATNGDVR
jgi:hypothetical protein